MNKGNKVVFAVLSVIVLYGFFLRVHGVGEQGLWIDEGASLMCARGIVERGVPMVTSGATLWSAFPYHYLISFPLSLFSESEVPLRVLSAFLGSFLIVLQYFLTKKCSKSVFAGLFSAFLMAFMTYEVAWSRQIRFYTFLQVLLVAGLLQMLVFIETRRWIHLLWALLWLVLAVFTHRSGYLLVLAYAFLFIFHTKQFVSGWSGKVSSDAGMRSFTEDERVKKRMDTWEGRWIQWCRAKAVEHRVFLLATGLACIVFGLVNLFLMAGGSSSLLNTLQMFMESEGTNYLPNYVVFLYEQMGWLILLIPIGIVMGVWWNWRIFVSLGLVCAAFGYMISFRSWLFAFRYILPIMPFLLIFLAQNFVFAEKSLVFAERRMKFGKKTGLCGKIVLLCVFCLLFSGSMKMSLEPQKEYWLGYTAPQPRWKDSFALVREREKLVNGCETGIVTVSAFPMFHDIYLGVENPVKYYLPISHTGYPDDIQLHAPYSAAKTVMSLDQLLRIDGYLVLDEFSLGMVADPEIKSYLAGHRYNAYVTGRFNTYVWILPPP